MKVLREILKFKFTSHRQRILLVLSTFGILFFWLAAVDFFLKGITKDSNILSGDEYNAFGNFFFLCILAPLWEELAFRVAPIQIAKKLGKALNKSFMLEIIIISSCLFGWGHGNGAVSLLLQGMLGAALCMVYIKTKYNYWSIVAIHFLWNFSVAYIFKLQY